MIFCVLLLCLFVVFVHVFFYFPSYLIYLMVFFFFKQKTAYEMRISDWSSDVCSSDLALAEGIDHGPLPCAILEPGDDADAIEASLIENMARLDPDEVTQWESFVRLVKEGRKVEDIAATFGLPDLAVKRVLALGNLLPRIRTMYAKEEIDRATVRHLTLASKSQQKSWLALADDDNAYLPTGHQLKAWLFGGQSIDRKSTRLTPVTNAHLV